MRRGGLRGTVVAAAILLALPASASAARIKVTTNADDFGSTPTSCSLREAVQTANTDSAFDGCVRKGTGTEDEIRLAGGTEYLRSQPATPDDTNVAGDLDISGPTTIQVRGEGRATINANLADRVIKVLSGGSLTASKLVITRGAVASGQPLNDTSGGGIAVAFDASLDLRGSRIEGNFTSNNENCACGGGIGVGGRTTLKRVTVEGNGSFGVGGGIALIAGPLLRVSDSRVLGNDTEFAGGGLYLGGVENKARITSSTIAENDALSFSNGSGGGIEVSGSGVDAKVTNSTLNRNEAMVNGGGIFIFSGSLSLNAVTVNDNVANADANMTGHGGGVFGPPAKARNSIIGGNFDFSAALPQNDCSSSFVGSRNVYQEGGNCFVGPKNVEAADVGVKPLADNGGPTETQALKPGSPAVGFAGKSAPERDQRGEVRDSSPDSGAYER